MPIQENEEVRQQPEVEESAHQSETLLPLFNAAYDDHMDKLDNLQEHKAEVQDKISKSENKIAVLEEKVAKLEATNAMLGELIEHGKLPKIAQKIIDANADKIKAIQERQIPKLENGIKQNQEKISKLDSRIAVVQLKAEKLRNFSNVIRSFLTPDPQKRRELFCESMDGLRNSTKNLLNIDRNAAKNKLAKLSEQYEKSDSMAEKYKLGQKIEAVKSSISSIEAKIHRLETTPKFQEADDHTVDKTIAKTESEIENTDFFAGGEIFDMDKPAETVALDSSEYLRNAEMSMEDDFNMIDGIINNGKKEERPDVPLFLEEIDVSTCDDATLQSFRESAKANMECAKEISQALSQNYDYERYTLNSEQALRDVREKFSDDRIAFVLANVLQGISDGRISKEVKDFAKETLQDVPELYTKRKLFLSSHAGLINLFAKTVMQAQPEKQVEKQAEKPTPEKKEPQKTRSGIRKINPNYYRQIPPEDRVITNEPAKVGAIIMTELEKQKIPFSAVETEKGVTITVAKENEDAFRAAEDKAKDTHVRLVNPEFFKQIPQEDRAIQPMSEKEARETMQKLEKDGIPFSARLDGEKSAVTVRKSEAPAYFSRRQMKKLAQEVKTEGAKPKEPKNKGQEL
ncbi:DUF3849 domain-containing protein [Ruminococcus callidus]|uniref:DUF3849 domain-containing protein n=1 Tax=Ruminococcus callidus TaxID=40519 RepID=UPI0035204919